MVRFEMFQVILSIPIQITCIILPMPKRFIIELSVLIHNRGINNNATNARENDEFCRQNVCLVFVTTCIHTQNIRF